MASGVRFRHDLAAVLDHLEVKHDAWLETVEQYEEGFGHAVGRPASLARRGPADGTEATERHIRLPQCVHVMALPALR